MSAKKKLPTSILSSSQKGEKEKKNLEDVPFELLFQRMVPFDGIIMCNQDIKTHSLAVGSRVIVSVGSSFIICTIGASKVGLQSGVVIVGKTLQPNFDISNGTSSSSALKVKISTDFRRVRLLLCEKISITMTSSPSSATKKSDSEKFAYTSSSTSNNSDFQLKELIKAIFLANNIFVVNNQKFNISYNGSYHSVQIAAQVNSDSSTHEDHTFYSISESTIIEFDSIPTSSSGSQFLITGLPAGYEEEASVCIKYLSLGLESECKTEDKPMGSLHSSLTQPPRGLLVHGASGIGKSRFVNHLITASQFSRCTTISIGSDILLKKFVGELESDLTSRVAKAVQGAPSFLLLEELDLLCPDRGSASDIQKRFVACLLRLIDELRNHRVFLIATSSRPNSIEKALRRPGRFDKELELSVPSSAQREAILYQLCLEKQIIAIEDENDKNATGSTNTALKRVAAVSHGMVASDLTELVKEALCTSVSRNRKLSCVDDAVVDNLAASLIYGLSINKAPQPVTEGRQGTAIMQRVSERALMSAAKSISPSALREIVVEVPKVQWTDIGGMDSVKQSLKEVVEWPLQHPDLFRALNMSPPRGVLLYGPPGCSKTLMAKALATESSMNFLAVRGPELLSKWLGESEKAVQSLFRRARSVAPCIIFFDEIDAFATKRGASSSGVNDRVLSQLLAELDGVQGLKQVVMVAATNRPDLLDPALLRPGRIDRKIFVSPPDAASREQILRLSLSKIPLLFDLEDMIVALVSLTERFSGAEIVSVCQEATMLAVKEESEGLTENFLLSSIASIEPQITDSMILYYDSMIKFFS